MPARSYKDHRFAAFVSYAFKDNLASANWVNSFHRELYAVAEGLLDGIDGGARPLRMIRENDIIGGKLASTLLSTVSDSYTLMVVVGPNYPRSEWCLNELQYFRQAHGDAAFNDRVLVVAINKGAMDALKLKPQWAELGLNENVWLKAFDEADAGMPITPYLDNGEQTRNFRRLVLSIGQRLADLASSPPPHPPETDQPRVLLGAVNPELQGARDALMQELDHALNAGTLAAAELITPAEVLAAAVDPEALKARMAGFDELLLPFNTGEPLLTMMPGGHLAMQRDCWAEVHEGDERAQNLRWLDCCDVPAARPANRRHEALFEQARGAAIKADRLPYLGGDALAVHVLIESNPEERDEWQRLTPRIKSIWDKLVGGSSAKPALDLRFGELRIDGNTDAADIANADAVLLLWGKKPPESVTAAVTTQGKRVTRFDGRSLGLVARLLPPLVDDPTAHSIGGWSVISFAPNPGAAGTEFVEVPEDSDSLEGFLSRVLRRRLTSTADAAAAS